MASRLQMTSAYLASLALRARGRVADAAEELRLACFAPRTLMDHSFTCYSLSRLQEAAQAIASAYPHTLHIHGF